MSALHKCEQDPNTWDRYSQYQNQDPTLRQSAVHLMTSGIKLGQAASFLNTQYGTRIQPKDVHCIVQINKTNMRSLSDAGVSASESARLLDEIEKAGDQFRIKYRDGTQVMNYIFYWDPSDTQMAQRFCQVLQVDSTFKDNAWRYPLVEITATTNEMNTFLIAQALIQSESAESLICVFEQVRILYIHIQGVLANVCSSMNASSKVKSLFPRLF